VAVSRCSDTQKTDEHAAMQHKASPSPTAPFLKSYREKIYLTQAQLVGNLKVELHTLHAWKNGVRSRRRSQHGESCR
jgi:DNA-binding transcriptional regulator YiaG